MDFFSMFDWTYLISGFVSTLIFLQFLYVTNDISFHGLLDFFLKYYSLATYTIYIIGMFTFLMGKYAHRKIFYRFPCLMCNIFKSFHSYPMEEDKEDKQISSFEKDIQYCAAEILKEAIEIYNKETTIDKNSYEEEYSFY